MDKPYFIVNPVSGSGLAAQKFKEVSKLLEAKGVDFSFDYTAAPRHATALAKAAIERGKRLIAAVGGDGTVNEVAAAIIGTDAVLDVCRSARATILQRWALQRTLKARRTQYLTAP